MYTGIAINSEHRREIITVIKYEIQNTFTAHRITALNRFKPYDQRESYRLKLQTMHIVLYIFLYIYYNNPLVQFVCVWDCNRKLNEYIVSECEM